MVTNNYFGEAVVSYYRSKRGKKHSWELIGADGEYSSNASSLEDVPSWVIKRAGREGVPQTHWLH